MNVEFIKKLRSDGKTYDEIANIYAEQCPDTKRGFSASSIRRFCKKHGIKGTTSKQDLEEAVKSAVSEVSFILLQ